MAKRDELPEDLEDLPSDLEDLGAEQGAVAPTAPHAAPRGPSLGDRVSAGVVGLAAGGLPGGALGAARGPEAAGDAADALRQPGTARAAALGVSQGGTLGYADELGGLIARFLADGTPAAPGAAFQPAPDDTPELAALKAEASARQPSDYMMMRDRMRAEARGTSEADPIAYNVGQLGGAIGASVLTRRLPGLRGLSGPGGAALSGAVEGGVGGLGASEAEPPLGMLADTALSAGLGAAGGAGGEYLGQGLAALGSWAGRRAGNALSQGSESLEEGLRRWAQERALKAAGYIQSDFPERIDDVLPKGAALLDEPGLMRPGNSVAELREKIDALVGEEGRAIGRYLDAADATPVNPGLDYAPVEFNPYALAQRIETNVARPASYDPSLVPQAQRVLGWVDDLRAGTVARTMDGQPFTFRAANEMKGNLQDLVHSARSGEVPLSKKLQEQVQSEMIREIDDQVAPLLGPDGVAGFQEARRRYGTFANVLEKAQRGERREVGNQFLGLGDRVQGAAATAVDPTGGVATSLLSKAVRGRADSAAAVGADRLSRNLPQVTSEAMSATGAAVGAGLGRVAGAELQDWLREVLAADPEAASRWAGALGAASAGGPEALAGTHYELGQQDPEYQARMRRAGGQEQ